MKEAKFKKGGLTDGAGSEWDESKHPRDEDGKFSAVSDVAANAKSEGETSRETEDALVADRIASVHIEQGRDNILPELSRDSLVKMGAVASKPVLVKAKITERNPLFHPDVNQEDTDAIIGEALYNPSKIFKGNKDGYFVFAQVIRISSKSGEPTYGTVLLDINETLENFEVVHWHFMIQKELDRAEKKNN